MGSTRLPSTSATSSFTELVPMSMTARRGMKRGAYLICFRASTAAPVMPASLPRREVMISTPSAAQDDDLGVEQVHEAADGNTDVFRGFLDDLLNKLVTAADRLAQVAALQVFQLVAQHLGEDGLLPVFHGVEDAIEDGRAARQR